MLFRHSSIYLLAKIIPGLIALAALSLYTHLLSPAEYGIYTLITSAAALFHSIVYNWINAGTMRFWANKKYNYITFTSTLFSTYIKISLALFVVTILIIVINAWVGNLETKWIIATYFLLLAVAAYTTTQNIYTVELKPDYFAYMGISYSVLSLIFGGLFAYIGLSSTGVVAGVTLGTIIPVIFVFKEIWLPYKKTEISQELTKKIMVYGLPFASIALLEEVTKVSDRFMLSWLQGPSQAGLYTVGYDLSGYSILMIMTAINLASYPVIIKLLETEGKKAAMDYFREYSILLIGISIPAVVGLNLIGGDLVYLLIDKEFQDSVILLLPWITLAVLTMGLQASYFDIAFQLSHRLDVVVKITIVVAIVNFILNYWLIPIMGINGAAIATLSSFALGSLLSAIIGRRYFTLPYPIKDFVKILVSSFVMGVCLWWIKDMRGWGWLLIQFLVGALSYLVMIIAFNILNLRTHAKRILMTRIKHES